MPEGKKTLWIVSAGQSDKLNYYLMYNREQPDGKDYR